MQRQEDVPVVGMDGFLLTKADLVEKITWERKRRWLNVRHWQGWTVLGTLAQVIVLIILFLYSGPLLRLIDPTAATLDIGVLSAVLLAILVVDAFVVLAWLLLLLVRHTLTEFYEWDDEHEYLKKRISTCLEVKILTGIFSGLVLLFWSVFLVLL
ncbi:hypothetical protein SAMN05216436_11328 [bacterium A37T11]|nr:hypothetical protein SAMN05216436_11328 [bacterium A37T11]